MMKHIFPVMILISIAGILVFAGTQAQAVWALIPLVATVAVGLAVFSAFKTKSETNLNW